jgi:hypothetical protein
MKQHFVVLYIKLSIKSLNKVDRIAFVVADFIMNVKMDLVNMELFWIGIEKETYAVVCFNTAYYLSLLFTLPSQRLHKQGILC